MIGAVGPDRPQSLGIAEIPVNVFPAIIEDASVGQQRAVALEQRALADLMNVGPVRFHAKQVGHDMPVAHAILRLARGRKGDCAVRQIQRINVRHAPGKGQLAQAGAVRPDFINMEIIVGLAAHGKKDGASVEGNIRVAYDAVRTIQQRPRGAGRDVQNLQGRSAPKTRLIDFALLKHRFGIVMILAILRAHNEQDGIRDGCRKRGLRRRHDGV